MALAAAHMMDVLKNIGIGAIILLLAAVLLWFGAAVWATRHVAKNALGSPTPAEANIESQTKKTAGEISAEGERKRQEVLSADKKTLLDLARAALWRVRKPK